MAAFTATHRHFHTTVLALGFGLLSSLSLGLRADQGEGSVESLGSAPAGLDGLIASGALPAHYTGFRLTFPPATRFVHVLWVSPPQEGTSEQPRVQARTVPLASNEARPLSLFVSLPTYQPFWATRTPLPYNDLPWRETCRHEAPLHVWFQAFPYPGSVLWCSGVPAEAFRANTGTGASYHYLGGLGGTSGLRLNRWTPLFGAVHTKKRARWGGYLMIAPTTTESRPPLPQASFDKALQTWKLAP